MSFNTSFVQAFNPAFQQSGQAVIDLQRQKMQEAIQEESRKRALQDQIDQGLLAKWQEAYSTTPPPMVTGTDGNQSLNRASMRGLLSEYESKKKDSDYTRQLSIQNNAKLDADGAKLGVVKEAAPSWKPGDGSVLNPMRAQGVRADTFAQRIAGAEKQDRLDTYQQERDATAQAQMEADKAKQSMQLKNYQAMYLALNPGADINGQSARNFIADKIEYAMLPDNYKKAHLQTITERDLGLLSSDNRLAFDKRRNELANLGGGTPALESKQVNTLVGDQALVRNVGSLIGEIKKFDAKYGEGSFDKYVGPFDSRKLEAKNWLSTGTPMDQEATGIKQLYQSILNAKIKDTSGAQTSAQEILRNMIEAGDPKNANFSSAINNFANNQATLYSNRVDALKGFQFPSDDLKGVDGKSPLEYLDSIRNGTAESTASPSAQPGKQNSTAVVSQAMAWAMSHPNDPRSKLIIEKINAAK